MCLFSFVNLFFSIEERACFENRIDYAGSSDDNIETDDGEDQHFDLSDDLNPDDHNIPEEENIIAVPLPDSIDKIRGRDLLPSELLSNVDAKKLNLTKDDDYNLGIIEDQLRADELTLKGFNIKKTAILQPYVRRYVMRGE